MSDIRNSNEDKLAQIGNLAIELHLVEMKYEKDVLDAFYAGKPLGPVAELLTEIQSKRKKLNEEIQLIVNE